MIRKHLRKIGVTLLIAACLTTWSHGDVKPPPDLAYIQTLGNQDMIIGEYIVFMPKLTQEIYDAALLTVSDDQKIYYKSEFADGTWFQIDDASDLIDIQLTGNTETITEEAIAKMYFILQVPQNGDELIYFMDSGAAKTRFDEKTDALKESMGALNASIESIKKQSLSEDPTSSVEGLVAESDYASAQLNALLTSVGKGPEAEVEESLYLTADGIALLNAEVQVLKELAADAEEKGFDNLADAANLEVMAKLTLLLEDSQAKAADPDYAAELASADELAALTEQISDLNAGVDQTVPDISLGGLTGLVKGTLKDIVSKQLLEADLDTIGIQNAITNLLASGELENNEVVATLMDALSDIECAACAQGLHSGHTKGTTGGDTGAGSAAGMTAASQDAAQELQTSGMTSEILEKSIQSKLDQLQELLELKLAERLATLAALETIKEESDANVEKLKAMGVLTDLGTLDPAIGQKLDQLRVDLQMSFDALPSLDQLNAQLSGAERTLLNNALNQQANVVNILLDANLNLAQQKVENSNGLASASVSMNQIVDDVRKICDTQVGAMNASLEYDYIDDANGLIDHREGMAKDLERLLVYLTDYQSIYDESVYDQVLRLMKERYNYLYDYEVEKQNEVGISLESLDAKVRSYDLEINQLKTEGALDLYKLQLEFDIWVASKRKETRTEQEKRNELAVYLANAKAQLDEEIALYETLKAYYSRGLYKNTPNLGILDRIARLLEIKQQNLN